MTSSPPQERVFEGLGVSPGIGVGIAHVRESGAVDIPRYRITAAKVDAERRRFQDAVQRSRRQVGRLRSKARSMSGTISEELDYLLEAYQQMLKDSRLTRGADRRIAEDRINAEAAVQGEMSEIAGTFAEMDDAYFAARLDDIREVAGRLLRNLTKTRIKSSNVLPKGSIVVADELTPADTALMDPTRIAGIASMQGGAEGHTAIMARALGLPAVLGTAGLLDGIRDGDTVVVNGDAGRVIINPSPATVAAFEARREERQRENRRLARLSGLPAVTRDGAEVILRANVELPVELDVVQQVGADGIGLLRTEFMFMNRDDVPGEEEQYEALREMVLRANGNSVTIRTLDVGAEKAAKTLTDGFGESASSALGLRGIRLSLRRTEVLEAQFRAILRASAHGPVRILLPMVTTVGEMRRAREILTRMARRLKRRGAAIADPMPPIGVMIEVPGAALAADALALDSDFFAIGSNDLTMYTLAIDRADEHVAYLYNPLHPAVLRLIQFSAEAALRADIPVTICGEMAGDPRFTALLLGLGFREMSMTASNVPRVKQRIRSLDIDAASRAARTIMEQVDAGRIATLIDDFNALA
jgi:phosphoenolpyruvate-protein phosphotransferase (PTS system enzyme I)